LVVEVEGEAERQAARAAALHFSAPTAAAEVAERNLSSAASIQLRVEPSR
jgi:hypothetical protein